MIRRLALSSLRYRSLAPIRRNFAYNRIKDFIVKAWKDTYPDEEDGKKDFHEKMLKTKQEAVKRREEDEKIKNLTEEELAEVLYHLSSTRRTFQNTRKEHWYS